MLIQGRRFGGSRAVVGAAALSLFLSVVSGARAGVVETRFTVVDSSPTSWVARGYSDYTVSPDIDWTFSVSRNFDNGIGLDIRGSALPGTSVTNWFLNFAAPFSVPITPGFYPDLQRFPFQDNDRPGLEFGSTGRLDNRASGFFEVFEATYGLDGEVLAFAADFTHYGETNLNNYAIVEVRYNATIPEPGTATLAVFGALAFLIRRRKAAPKQQRAA